MNRNKMMSEKILDNALDGDGESIFNFNCFWRDVDWKSKDDKMKAISFSDPKNKWVYFGLWILHPTRNLIARMDTAAANAYGYGGFTRIVLGIDSIENIRDRTRNFSGYAKRMDIKHSEIVEMMPFFNPQFSHDEPVTSIELSAEYMGIKEIEINEFYQWSNRVDSVRDGYVTNPVFRITEEERSIFMKEWERLPSEMVSFARPETSPSKVYTEKYYRRIIDMEKAREKEQQSRKRKGEVLLHEWEPAPALKMIYLMKDQANGFYKIGVSNKPKAREQTLQSEKPTIKLVGAWENLSDKERSWHEYFSRQRMRGEWFSLTKAQARFFVHRCLNKVGPPEAANIFA